MKGQRHLLSAHRKSHPAYLANEHTIHQTHAIGKHLAEILAIGPFYYYTINISDNSLYHATDTILSIHGFNGFPETLQQIIDLIHPEDIDFVISAEQAILEKMKAIGFEHRLYLKTSYCFRMLMADGSYHLFHHQVVSLAKDEEERLISALHIHTDIQHITQVNDKVILIKGIGKRNDYYQMDLSEKNLNMPIPLLSRREMEILVLLAQGLSSQQIGEKLFISTHTVRVHRKQLLKKTQTVNSSNLIKKCIELNLL